MERTASSTAGSSPPGVRALLCGLLVIGLTGCIARGVAPTGEPSVFESGVQNAQAPRVPGSVSPALGSATTGALTAEPVLWKERLEQPYVYVEVYGDYRRIGDTMRALQQRAGLANVEASGPPFVLYFDDPARVDTDRLRARACLPVRAQLGSAPGLALDLLPRAMVAYTNVRGAYPELPRVYPSLFAYLRDHGWTANGPLREIYFTDPGAVASWDELQSELQLPWRPAGG